MCALPTFAGVNRLTVDDIAGVVDLVEAMHYNIASVRRILAKPKREQIAKARLGELKRESK